MLALLSVALGALLGLASLFRSRPYPALLPIVVGGLHGTEGRAIAFAESDLAALVRPGLFARTLGEAKPLALEETVARRLERLGDVSARESLVVYLQAPARVGVEGEIEILATEAQGEGPDRWMPLLEVLGKVAACRARNRLMLIDVMRPMADPIRGILADDVAGRLEATLASAAHRDQEWFVLAACGPGQRSWASEELGRSIFGLAIEEGLLGRADTEAGNGDGRVTVRELARHVTRRTQAWASHNRGARQTPVLLEYGVSGDRAVDFALAPRRAKAGGGEPGESEARNYPDWLKAAWARRDGLVAEGSARLEPRALRRLNATLLAAERDWRAGLDAAQVQTRLEAETTALLRQFARLKSEWRLPSRSLALEERQGRVPDPAVVSAVSDLVKKHARPAIGLKPEEAAAASAKLVADFQSATQDKPDFDVARRVFEEVANITVPSPQEIRFLDGLLRARQPAPEWVEIVALHRLADRAEAIAQGKLPADAWQPSRVRKLLEVVRQGERAHARAGGPDWVRPWLDDAAVARHMGEVAFEAVGYVPPDQVDGYLDRASVLYAAVLAAQDRYQSALELRDQALTILPDYLPYLEHAPELFSAWSEVAQATDSLDSGLTALRAEHFPVTDRGAPGQTPGLEVLRASGDRLDRLETALRSPLERIRTPFSAEALAGLIARAREPKEGAGIWRAMSGLLDVPVSSAEERAALWTAGHDLAQRLEATTPSDIPLPASPADVAPADDSAARLFDIVRRAKEAISLLKLAGFGAEYARDIETKIGQLAPAGKADAVSSEARGKADWPRLGEDLHNAWAGLIETVDQRNLGARGRLVEILPGSVAATAFDLGLEDPIAELRKRSSTALQAWLADWFRYVGHDQGPNFFLQAAQEYAQGLEHPSLHPLVRIRAPAEPIVVGEEAGQNTSAQEVDLEIELQENAGPPAAANKDVGLKAARRIAVSVIQASPDWLDISLERGEGRDPLVRAKGSSATMVGPFVIEPADSGPVPLRLRLEPRRGVVAESAGTSSPVASPAGILVQIEAEGRVFSRTIPVVVRSAGQAMRIVLGDGARDQEGSRKVIRLRPLPVRQAVPVSVRNPSSAARQIIVELRLGEGTSGPVLVSPRMTIAPGATHRVTFSAPPPGTATSAGSGSGPSAPGPPAGGNAGVPLAALEGPLHFRILDAQRPDVVLGQRVAPVEVANPREYVRVEEAALAPARPVASEPNRLSVSLRSLLSPPDPAAKVVLVLRPERITGFISVEKGVLQGDLPAGGDLSLTAESINVDPASSGTGVVELTIDSVERAVLLKTEFARSRDVSKPLIDGSLALRLRAPLMARTGTAVPVVLEVDNEPEQCSLELSLRRAVAGRFEPIQTWTFGGGRRRRVGVDPAGPGGFLLFEAGLGDWSQTIETSGLRGRFPLRARLRRGDGLILKEVEREVLLDDQRPRWINLAGVPRRAKRGRTLEVMAVGDSPPSGIAAAQFFVGKPGPEGKLVPGTLVVPGKRQAGKSERWKATLKLPADKGEAETAVSVRFITGVGLDAVDTVAIELGDTDSTQTGTVKGVVREGTLAQKDLVVGLFDAKGNKLREGRTSATGSFRFDDLAPGIYYLTSARPVAATKGQVKAEVKAEQTAEVAISLYR
jgi:hypothetical protein